MLNWALLKSPVNWFTIILMVMLAQLFFEIVVDPSSLRTCGCDSNK